MSAGATGAAGTAAHAELAQVWPRDGRLRLVGRLHGHEPAPGDATGWRLLLVLRDAEPERRLDYPAPLDGPAFDVSLPVADLLSEAHGSELPAYWDLCLARGTGAERLRVGRQLDDIRGKKKIMVFPAQAVTAAGRSARVRPYYTIKDNLSVEVRPGR